MGPRRATTASLIALPCPAAGEVGRTEPLWGRGVPWVTGVLGRRWWRAEGVLGRLRGGWRGARPGKCRVPMLYGPRGRRGSWQWRGWHGSRCGRSSIPWSPRSRTGEALAAAVRSWPSPTRSFEIVVPLQSDWTIPGSSPKKASRHISESLRAAAQAALRGVIAG